MSARQAAAIKAWWADRFASGAAQRFNPELAAVRKREQSRVRARVRPKADPEKQRAWYALNRDSVLAARRVKYLANIEKHRERDRARRRTHADLFREQDRVRYAANTERDLAAQKAWRSKNMGLVRANARLREARKVATSIGPVDYDLIMSTSNGICGICGAAVDVTDPKAYHFDHKIPLSRGGGHVQANIQLAHAKCNLKKHARVA